ncbi:hypothetical protein CR513_18431, partial [Mucuna pruriens]
MWSITTVTKQSIYRACGLLIAVLHYIHQGDFGVLKMGNDGVTKVIGIGDTKALVAKDSVNAMDMEAPLWHRRLSHINEKWLNCLAKKDMLPGLKNAKLEKSSHCMAGQGLRGRRLLKETAWLAIALISGVNSTDSSSMTIAMVERRWFTFISQNAEVWIHQSTLVIQAVSSNDLRLLDF